MADKRLGVTACVRAERIDMFKSQKECQNLKDILEKYLRSKYCSLKIDSSIEMPTEPTTSNNIGDEDNADVPSLSLAQCEAIIASHVESCFVGYDYLLRQPVQANLIDQLEKLSIRDKSPGTMHRYVKLSDCEISLHLYYNMDKATCESSYVFDVECDKVEQMARDDKGLSLNRYLLATFSAESFEMTHIMSLPNSTLESQWERLYIDPSLKSTLFKQCQFSLKLSSSLKFSSNNFLASPPGKTILISGPPGTGKTTLSKALSHRLCASMFDKYRDGGILIEVECPKLFSKWFGESSLKLSHLFNDVERLATQDRSQLIFLLIDEIETFATARTQLIAQNESSDGVRVVNTLLTHLDRLHRFENIIIFATSNLVQSIDPAFIDRCDSCFELGFPTTESIYHMLQSTINAYIDHGVITTEARFKDYYLVKLQSSREPALCENHSCVLLKICELLHVSPLFSQAEWPQLSLLTEHSFRKIRGAEGM